MKITVSQLRKIISEEVTKVISRPIKEGLTKTELGDIISNIDMIMGFSTREEQQNSAVAITNELREKGFTKSADYVAKGQYQKAINLLEKSYFR